jgi:signal peptidase II
MIAFGTYVYYRAPVQRHYHLLRFVCVLLVAGALGNMLDRIFYQHVTDFFYLTLINFPVFNVADCYVCVGAFLAVISLFTIYREDEFEFLRKH